MRVVVFCAELDEPVHADNVALVEKLAKIGDAWPGAYSLSTTEQLDEVPTVPQIDAAMAIVRALRTALGIR
jgi:hypothetical protein